MAVGSGVVGAGKADLKLRKNWWINLKAENKYQQTIIMNNPYGDSYRFSN